MRDARLEGFLTALGVALDARADADAPVGALHREIVSRAAQAKVPQEPACAPGEARDDVRPFVDGHLDDALRRLEAADDDLAAVGRAFRDLADELTWARRPAGPHDPPGFQAAHANATVVGVDGIEARCDIRIGASLLAPAITYPAHTHPPEELYLVLSDGDWRNAAQDWWTPGVGGVVHNPPGIEHAMRAGDAPLFAIWCLLIEADGTAAR